LDGGVQKNTKNDDDDEERKLTRPFSPQLGAHEDEQQQLARSAGFEDGKNIRGEGEGIINFGRRLLSV